MEIGIIGLPNSSKTTVFNALTRGQAETAAFSSARFTVHRAMVDVPDPRVDVLADMFRPRKVTRAKVSYKDIGGLTRGISGGELAGEVFGALAQNDALLHVVRAFEADEIEHPEGSVDPARDVATVDAEFLLSDQIVVERRLERLADALRRPGKGPEHEANAAEEVVLGRIHEALEAETPVRDLDLSPAEAKAIRGFQLLTAKPLLIVLNTGDAHVDEPSDLVAYDHARSAVTTIRGRLEMDLAQLPVEEQAVFAAEYGVGELGLERVIRLSYGLLGLQSFFTVGEDEVRAWTVPLRASAIDAAGAIHTDLARGFIRAEVVAAQDLVELGSMAEARKAGRVRLEGRDYVVADGDVLNIRFNV